MPTDLRRILHSVLISLSLSACAGLGATEERGNTPPTDRPYVLVLGSAQDGGQPQIGCACERCETARAEPGQRRLVSSLLLVDPVAGTRYLFDASPDLIEQVELAKGHSPSREKRLESLELSGRPPLFEGVFLTHAHMGHYTGLLHLGRESYGAKDLAVFGTQRLCDFLRANDPWSQMIDRGTLVPSQLEPEHSFPISSDITVTPLLVPHRDEYSDTVAFVIATPRASLLFLPDIDKWERWEGTRIEDILASVDYALIDGTFYADGEIPGRAMDEIPHPFIAESMARLGNLLPTERAKILFTHFNHTNPVSDEASAAAREVRAAGFGLAREGMILEL